MLRLGAPWLGWRGGWAGGIPLFEYDELNWTFTLLGLLCFGDVRRPFWISCAGWVWACLVGGVAKGRALAFSFFGSVVDDHGLCSFRYRLAPHTSSSGGERIRFCMLACKLQGASFHCPSVTFAEPLQLRRTAASTQRARVDRRQGTPRRLTLGTSYVWRVPEIEPLSAPNHSPAPAIIFV